MLIQWAERHFMEQYIKESTRGSNILDLIFCSDPALILEYRQIINSRNFSDYNSLVVDLFFGLNHLESDKRVNYALTTVPEYDTKCGDDEDWMRMNMLLQKINLEEELANNSVQEMTDKVLSKVEKNVSLIFKKRDEFAEENEHDESEESKPDEKKTISNNRIPKPIRKLFIQKRMATKSIFKSTSAKRCLALKIKIYSIEEDLKSHYKTRRSKVEKEAINKIKKNPNAFYTYAKKFAKTFSGVGPLIDADGKVITDPKETAEALKRQYEEVFSKPDKDMAVKSLKKLFLCWKQLKPKTLK